MSSLLCFDSEGDNRNQAFANAYAQKLSNISEDDLFFIEKDLNFYEKVSLTFLLFGGDKIQRLLYLQRLLVLSANPQAESDILLNYSRINSRWRDTLLEALSIIKAHRVIRKLGFRHEDLRSIFLPHNQEAVLRIHPILKSLYLVAESLTIAEAGQITTAITEEQELNFRFYDGKYLEIYLLDWITKNLITIGDWSPEDFSIKSPANLDVIIKHLKFRDKQKDMLFSIVKRFNRATSTESPKEIHQPREPQSTTSQNNFTVSAGTSTERSSNENDSAEALCENLVKLSSKFTDPDESYIVRRDRAGFLLIINQRNFTRDNRPELQHLLPEEELKIRCGTEKDEQELERVASSFGYKTIIKNDVNHLEMIHAIEEIVKRSYVYDSLIVCILSHGKDGIVYGSNSIPVEINKITQIVAADTLLNKPKMIIIQACQGSYLQQAKIINDLEYDGPVNAAPMSDMLVAMSTVPGFASVRDKNSGTWYIQTLCKIIDKQGDRKDLLNILTSVNRDVSKKRNISNECMVPQSNCTLTKLFYLPKRDNNS